MKFKPAHTKWTSIKISSCSLYTPEFILTKNHNTHA